MNFLLSSKILSKSFFYFDFTILERSCRRVVERQRRKSNHLVRISNSVIFWVWDTLLVWKWSNMLNSLTLFYILMIRMFKRIMLFVKMIPLIRRETAIHFPFSSLYIAHYYILSSSFFLLLSFFFRKVRRTTQRNIEWEQHELTVQRKVQKACIENKTTTRRRNDEWIRNVSYVCS